VEGHLFETCSVGFKVCLLDSAIVQLPIKQNLSGQTLTNTNELKKTRTMNEQKTNNQHKMNEWSGETKH
jgi:hypothetical protein